MCPLTLFWGACFLETSRGAALAEAHRKIRVAIADDHPVFRDAVRALVSLEPDLEVVAEAEDGDEAIKVVKQENPDILLLDLLMPRLDGLSALQRIRSDGLLTKVIVLTVSEDETSHVLAMKYGAAGIIRKSMATNFLIEGIRRVQDGEVCLDDHTMVLVLRKFSTQRKPPPMSQREWEVASLVCQGFRNKEIAGKLFVTEDTVKSHLSRIYDKFDVSDRMHLVLYAIESGIPFQQPG